MNRYSRRIAWAVIACSMAVLPVFAVDQIWGGDPMNVWMLPDYVADYAWVLSADTLQELRSLATIYQAQTSNELAAVLIPNRNGNELFDISMKIFRENKIGDDQKNNGVLLVISTEEKKLRITVGYGLEGVFPDVAASEVIEKYLRPLVNAGDFSWAIRTYYEVVPKYIWGEYTASTTNSAGELPTLSVRDVLLALAAGLYFIITAARIKKKTSSPSKAWTQRYMKYFIPGFLIGMLLSSWHPFGIILAPWGFLWGSFLGLMILWGGMSPMGGFGGWFGSGGWWSSWGGGWFSGFGGGSSWGWGAGD